MSGGQGKLWAFGDSFTFGSELKDCPDEFQHSNNTWPALLAKERKLEYRCVAQGGISNDWIARNVLKYLDQIHGKNDLIIIQWTYYSRFEFNIHNYHNKGLFRIWTKPGDQDDYFKDFEDPNYFQTSPNLVDNFKLFDQKWAKPKVDNFKESKALDFNEQFYRLSYNDEYGAYNLLKNIKLIQSIVQFKNYKFSFVSNEILKYNESKDPMFKNIIDSINPNHLIWFGEMDEYLGFNDWCIKKKFPKGPYNHPLEQAHREAFKYVKEMRYV